MKTMRLAVVLAAVALSTGCGGADEGGAAPDLVAVTERTAAPATVTIAKFAFDPKALEVVAGSELTVVNDDEAAHTLTADDGSFDTGDLAGGESGVITVEGSGDVPYHCIIHEYMRGTLTVS